MDLIDAEQTIRDLADDLTAQIHAKGYDRARIEFWIGSRKGSVTWMISGISDFDRCGWSNSVSGAADGVRGKIAGLHDAHAYDADFSAPLFLLSEQHAQAAE